MKGPLGEALGDINQKVREILDDLIAAKKRRGEYSKRTPLNRKLVDNATREIEETEEDLRFINKKRGKYLEKIRERCPHTNVITCDHQNSNAQGGALLHLYLCTRCGTFEDDWGGPPRCLNPLTAKSVTEQEFDKECDKVEEELKK